MIESDRGKVWELVGNENQLEPLAVECLQCWEHGRVELASNTAMLGMMPLKRSQSLIDQVGLLTGLNWIGNCPAYKDTGAITYPIAHALYSTQW